MNNHVEDVPGAAEANVLALARRHFDALQSAVHAGLDTETLRAQQEAEIRACAASWSKPDVPRLLAAYAAEIQTLSVDARATRRAQADQQGKSTRFYWQFVAAALMTVSVIAAIALPSCSPRH